jgi:hypothetical protein
MKRGRVLLLATAIASAITLAAACTIPNLDFVSSEGGAPDSSGGDDVSDTGSDAPVGANEDVDPGGADADAQVAPDVQRVDSGPECCDCDGDQVQAEAGADAAGCPGLPKADCDDGNKVVFSGQSYVISTIFDSPHKPQFDWNCDGVVTKQYDYDQDCSDVTRCTQGFVSGDPGCGKTAAYNVCDKTCVTPLLCSCSVKSSTPPGTYFQGCK